MLRSAKNIVYKGLCQTGITSRISSSSWRGKRLVILCYHGIAQADEHEWSDLYISQVHLKNRFEILASLNYSVLPLHLALELVRQGKLPEKSVVITFDDGAYDFYLLAYPLLEKFQFHATLYLTTYYCFRQTPVFDAMLSYLMWKGVGKHVKLKEFCATEELLIPTVELHRQKLHLRLRSDASKNLSEKEKQDVLRSFASQLNIDYGLLLKKRIFQIMDPGEIRQLDPRLVDIQLHTHRHRMPIDEGDFRKEIFDNRRAIETILEMRNWQGQHFCYPSGEYHSKYFPLLNELGIRSAVTCDPGLVSRSSAEFALPRFIDTMSISEEAFLAWISGVGSWLPRRPNMSH